MVNYNIYGLNQQAVENQLFITLITYCLLALLKLEVNYRGPLLTIKRILCACLYASFELFIKTLYRQPIRASKGRRKVDYDTIYQNDSKTIHGRRK